MGPRLDVAAGGGVRAHGQAPTDEGGRILIFPRRTIAGQEVARAPQIVAVGDLHVGSFGTWRDGEGRLCWGVDDFDEAYPLPYTNGSPGGQCQGHDRFGWNRHEVSEGL